MLFIFKNESRSGKAWRAGNVVVKMRNKNVAPTHVMTGMATSVLMLPRNSQVPIKNRTNAS